MLINQVYICSCILGDFLGFTELCTQILKYLNNEGNKFGGFIFGILIGMIISFSFMRYTMWNSSLHYKRSIKEYKEQILELKILVHDKLDKIKIKSITDIWFVKLKKYFYKTNYTK